jgi:hypothetical protein
LQYHCCLAMAWRIPLLYTQPSVTDCAEKISPLLFTGRCPVTAACWDSTVPALSEYATVYTYVLGMVLTRSSSNRLGFIRGTQCVLFTFLILSRWLQAYKCLRLVSSRGFLYNAGDFYTARHMMRWRGSGSEPYYPNTCLEGLRKITKSFSQLCRCPGRASNLAPPEYICRARPLHQPANDWFQTVEAFSNHCS